MTTVRRRHLLRLLPGLLAAPWVGANASPHFSIGIVPQFPLDQIYTNWTPLLAQLRAHSGLQLAIKPYASIPDFELGFRKGEIDIAYLNPYHAVMARRAAGYRPLLRDDQERLTGILVVRQDSPLRHVAALQGASIAFPSPNAFGASLYMRALLTQEFGLRFTALYRTTHSNVFRHVLAGRAAAGGGLRRTLEREPPEVREQLRILYETPPAYPHPIAVHPRVPAAVCQALQAGFQALRQSPEGAALLAAVPMPQPVAASYAEYAPLEKLGLERYVVLKED